MCKQEKELFENQGQDHGSVRYHQAYGACEWADPCGDGDKVPFESAEEAWFWFIQAQQARNDGARFVAGASIYPRPCEPVDILKILDRLHRNRQVLRDHLLVLRHYGRRALAPDPAREKEVCAHQLWCEALDKMEPILERKGIVKKASFDFPRSWTAGWHKQSYNA